MGPQRALIPIKWLTVLGLLVGLLSGAFAIHAWMRNERMAESKLDSVDVPRRAANSVVKLGARLAESHGITDEPAQAVRWVPRVVVTGRVVANPQASIEIRSPFAGTLRGHPEAPWPSPGRLVRAGQVLGYIDIRVGPQERLELQAKCNEARLRQAGAEETVRVQQDRLARFHKASGSEGLARKEHDDALVAIAEARTQLAIARAAVELWQKALEVIERGNGRPNSPWSEPLTLPMAGEVAELAARPGMAVEAGGLIARVIDFRRPLVRLDVPLDALPPAQVELTTPLGSTADFGRRRLPDASAAVVGNIVGPAAQVDSASQRVGYWYEVHLPEEAKNDASADDMKLQAEAWRPGLFVQSSFPVAGARPTDAVGVPRLALLVHQGRPLVYVRIGPGRYERREVQVLAQESNRWVLADGVTAGEAVVSRQAQVLLSEEFRGDADND